MSDQFPSSSGSTVIRLGDTESSTNNNKLLVPGSSRFSAIHKAARNYNYEKLGEILRKDPSLISTVDVDSGRSLLHLVLENGSPTFTFNL